MVAGGRADWVSNTQLMLTLRVRLKSQSLCESIFVRYLMMLQEVWSMVSEHQLTDRLQLKRIGRDLGFEMRM